MIPALTVADALRASGAEVAFIGGDRAEAQLVPAAGYEFHRLKIRGISRSNPLAALRAVFTAAAALITALRVLGKLRPDVVLGCGGYVAGPVGLAALLRRIPLVLTEADSHLGLTNRLLAPFARRVCLAFPIAGRESSKYLVTGRPVGPAADRAAARAHYKLDADDQLLLIFGGSLGARSINEAAIAAFADTYFRVLHVAGERDFATLEPPNKRYQLLAYLDHAAFSQALAACDLVVARAGGSVFEIAAAGRPAILIPYPHATADHQTENARWMADAGAAAVIADGELTLERLHTEVGDLLADRDRLAAMSTASASLARPDAAKAVAEQVLNA